MAELLNIMKYRGSFILNEEGGVIQTGIYYNWTSGIGGITTLEVINTDGNILQRETNPVTPKYCRLRSSTNSGQTWNEWVGFIIQSI